MYLKVLSLIRPSITWNDNKCHPKSMQNGLCLSQDMYNTYLNTAQACCSVPHCVPLNGFEKSTNSCCLPANGCFKFLSKEWVKNWGKIFEIFLKKWARQTFKKFWETPKSFNIANFLFVCLSVTLFVCLSVYLFCFYACLLFFFLFVCLFVCLSVSPVYALLSKKFDLQLGLIIILNGAESEKTDYWHDLNHEQVWY